MSTRALVLLVMAAAVLVPWALLAAAAVVGAARCRREYEAEDARNEERARDIAWASLMRATEREEAIAAADLILWELES